MSRTYTEAEFTKIVTKEELYQIWLTDFMWRIRELQGLKRPGSITRGRREDDQ